MNFHIALAVCWMRGGECIPTLVSRSGEERLYMCNAILPQCIHFYFRLAPWGATCMHYSIGLAHRGHNVCICTLVQRTSAERTVRIFKLVQHSGADKDFYIVLALSGSPARNSRALSKYRQFQIGPAISLGATCVHSGIRLALWGGQIWIFTMAYRSQGELVCIVALVWRYGCQNV